MTSAFTICYRVPHIMKWPFIIYGVKDVVQDGAKQRELLSAERGGSVQVKGRRSKILNNWMRERKKLFCGSGEQFRSVGSSPFQLGRSLCVESGAIKKARNDLVWYHAAQIPDIHPEYQLEVPPKGAMGV